MHQRRKNCLTKWRVTLGNNDLDPGGLAWRQAWPQGSSIATYLVEIPVKTKEEAIKFVEDLVKSHNEKGGKQATKWHLHEVEKAH